jgi:hypothetical protein
LVIQQPIRISYTSIHPPESSSLAITLCLIKHDIYNLPDLPLHNSFSI